MCRAGGPWGQSDPAVTLSEDREGGGVRGESSG